MSDGLRVISRNGAKHIDRVSILMYHSISDGAGPTCTPPTIFCEQINSLADCGCDVISLSDLVAWRNGDLVLSRPAVVLTFDDGFRDFMTNAFPTLQAHRCPATVFIPVNKMGGTDDWEAARPRSTGRRLLDWREIETIHKEGVEIGSHALTHRDLTRISAREARVEIEQSKQILETRLGAPVSSFAAPYGKTNTALVEQIRATYTLSVSTRFALMKRSNELHNLPRIEMFYFHNIRRWRAYLRGKASTYFHARRSLRAVRRLANCGRIFERLV